MGKGKGDRWLRHTYARLALRPGRRLSKAMVCYGTESFVCSFAGLDMYEREALALEQDLIERLGSLSPGGFNLSKGGEFQKHSEETIEKMRRAAKARGVGQLHSPESRRKASESRTGQKRSAATCAKIAEAKRHQSKETIAKIVAKRRAYSPEQRAKVAASVKAVWSSRTESQKQIIRNKISETKRR